MSGILTIKEVLQIMDTDKPFTVTVCTYDKNRNTGGERKTFVDARLLRNITANPNQGGVQLRNPNHRTHSTINIRCKNDDTISIHIPLIEKLNGQRVSL